MAKRLNAVSALDVDEVPAGDGSPDAFVFGGLKKLDTGIVKAMPISIMAIVPDKTQPRRVMPSAVRAAWDGKPDSMYIALDAWWKLANAELGATIPLKALLFEDGYEWENPLNEDGAAERYPLASGFDRLLKMAADIWRRGLDDPIKITPDKGDYQRIVKGERRWTAFHLLYALDETTRSKWEKIKCFVDPQFDRWEQAAENGHRVNLRGVALARQFALLLMDLHGVDHFAGFDEMVPPGQCDRSFYAQVADNRWRVPYGQGDRIAQTMGLQSAAQLRQLRMLLRIDDDLWQIADDENWPEQRIRVTAAGATTDDEDESVTAVTDLSPSPTGDQGHENDASTNGAPIITGSNSSDDAAYNAALDEIARQAGAAGQGGGKPSPTQLKLWDDDVTVALKRAARYTPQSIRNSKRREQALEDARKLETAAAAIRRMAGGS